MPKPNTAAQADLPNPITAALTDVLVGRETSFNRLSVVPLISRVPPAAPPYVTLDEALAGRQFRSHRNFRSWAGSRTARAQQEQSTGSDA